MDGAVPRSPDAKNRRHRNGVRTFTSVPRSHPMSRRGPMARARTIDLNSRELSPQIGNTRAAMAVLAPPSRARRASRRLAVVAAVIGALLVLDAVLTVVWQEPVTALAGRIEQHRLAGDLNRLMREGPTPQE